MPGLFHKREGHWSFLPVAASPSVLWFDPIGVEPGATVLPGALACLLVRAAGLTQWAALVPAGVAMQHNGLPIGAGLRLLDHRDALAFAGNERAGDELVGTELVGSEPAGIESTDASTDAIADARTDAATLFFSTEELAHVEPFAGDAPVVCPRCRSDLRPGDAAVRCPSCGVVHHESADRTCWSYAPACALCSQPTALDAGYRWTPEEDL